jgi:CubicO group peptidase (beta-lactamase class C family)
MGMDGNLLENLAGEIKARYRSISAFLVVRGGHLVFERYFHGYGPEDAHLVASVTKSFVSALIGISIEQGYITGVEQPVLEFFPEFVPGPRDHLKQNMTVENLLTMTAGFQWRTGARNREHYIDRLRRSPNWVEFILDLPVQERHFGRFQYNSAASHLLSAIISRSSGSCAQEFAEDNLFAPIGIAQPTTNTPHTFSQKDIFRNKSGGWPQDPQGNSIGGWGLVLKPRDMARFGYLYLNNGQWDGRQVIPRAWIKDSVTPYTPDYGYQWWLRDVSETFVFSAAGQGGQHIFCIPDKDLVVAVASTPGSRWRDRWFLLEQFVLPAVKA